MKYMLLIYSEPGAAPQNEGEMKRWWDYTEEMAKAGVLLGGDPLQAVDTATTVRNRDGQTSTVDGPFAETKEVLGGYYMIDVDDLDGALHWAGRCPGADYGSIEVRPLADMPDAPS